MGANVGPRIPTAVATQQHPLFSAPTAKTMPAFGAMWLLRALSCRTTRRWANLPGWEAVLWTKTRGSTCLGVFQLRYNKRAGHGACGTAHSFVLRFQAQTHLSCLFLRWHWYLCIIPGTPEYFVFNTSTKYQVTLNSTCIIYDVYICRKK